MNSQNPKPNKIPTRRSFGISLGLGGWDFIGIWDLGFYNTPHARRGFADEHERTAPPDDARPHAPSAGALRAPGRIGRVPLLHAGAHDGGLRVDLRPGDPAARRVRHPHALRAA